MKRSTGILPVSPTDVSPVKGKVLSRAKMALRLMGKMPMLQSTPFSYTLLHFIISTEDRQANPPSCKKKDRLGHATKLPKNYIIEDVTPNTPKYSPRAP